MSTRSLLGRLDPRRQDDEIDVRPDLEALARRFTPAVRREVRRLVRLSPRLADLAAIFPGALFAIAAGLGNDDERQSAVDLVLRGAPLKQVAGILDLPLWLKRLPPEAFTGPLGPLPSSETFSRRIANCLPSTRVESALWLQSVSFAARAAHEDFAIWLAHQPVFGETGDARRLFAVLAAYAWFSGQPSRPAHALMIVPWRSEISFETALCAAKSWLNRVRLVLQLKPGVIEEPWLDPGEAGGLQFIPLLTSEQLLEEAQAMHNCADQYADRIARDRCRLWSVRRRTGQRVATMEIGPHSREPGVLDVVQLKARHNLPAPLEVWQASHAFMSTQKGLRRMPSPITPARPLDPVGWSQLMAPYRQARDGAPWLPPDLTLAALGVLEADMADLARRAGVSSWLFT